MSSDPERCITQASVKSDGTALPGLAHQGAHASRGFPDKGHGVCSSCGLKYLRPGHVCLVISLTVTMRQGQAHDCCVKYMACSGRICCNHDQAMPHDGQDVGLVCAESPAHLWPPHSHTQCCPVWCPAKYLNCKQGLLEPFATQGCQDWPMEPFVLFHWWAATGQY